MNIDKPADDGEIRNRRVELESIYESVQCLQTRNQRAQEKYRHPRNELSITEKYHPQCS